VTLDEHNREMEVFRASAGRRLTVAIALAATLGLSASGCIAAAPAPTPTPDVASRLGAYLQKTVDAGAVGLLVRIDTGDTVIELVRQIAWAEDDRPLDIDDAFRVASNTKTVVATIVLQLVDEGLVELDAPIESYLPGAVPGGQSITVRMLLNHTSGLDDVIVTDTGTALLSGSATQMPTPHDLLALATAEKPVAAPGQTFNYSNANYLALGLMLEKVTGSPVSMLIDERITDPLGMRSTYLASDAADVNDDLAHGYEPDAEALAPLLPPELPPGFGFVGPEVHDHVNTVAIDPGWAWAAGGLVSTAQDWSRFALALQSGELVPSDLLDEMRTTVDYDRYGLGLEKRGTSCGVVWGHSGILPGYASKTYTDDTGTRTLAIFTTTTFGLDPPEAAVAYDDLIHAAVCAMFEEPLPGD